jgi:hypothetical protein
MAETLAVSDMLPNKFEPKRQFRWVLAIEGIDAFIVKTATRPNISIEEVPIPFINHTRYIAGKSTFETLSVTMHDPIAPSGAQQVMEWVRTHFESVSGRAGYEATPTSTSVTFSSRCSIPSAQSWSSGTSRAPS